MTSLPYGFRLQGALHGERRLVNWAAAFAAYASCDPRVDLEQQAYLSAFCYGEDFRSRADPDNFVKTADFEGPCWAPFLPWDIDRSGNLDLALAEARRLVLKIDEHLRLTSEDDLLIFFSGLKGFHLGLPTCLWAPEPSPNFHKIARQFAVRLAERAEVGVYDTKRGYRIDEGVYAKVQPFRAPNSRHKSGFYKRRLSFDELMGLSTEHLLKMAQAPEPFDVPCPAYRSDQAALDWRQAAEAVEQGQLTHARFQPQTQGSGPRLTRSTLAFLHGGAEEGDRHRLLFSAAANLGEFPDVRSLAHALLTEVGLDCGLPPKEVYRQIECGVKRGASGAGACTEPPPTEPARHALPSPEALHCAVDALWAASDAAPGEAATAPVPLRAPTGTPAPTVTQAQVAALWERPAASDAPTEGGDNLERQQREAILEHGGQPNLPSPSTGSSFGFVDQQAQPCPPAEAGPWTGPEAAKGDHVDAPVLPEGGAST